MQASGCVSACVSAHAGKHAGSHVLSEVCASVCAECACGLARAEQRQALTPHGVERHHAAHGWCGQVEEGGQRMGWLMLIRELHSHAGDLSCGIWGPHGAYFFRIICHVDFFRIICCIMEPSQNFFRGQHFACGCVLRSGHQTKEEREGLGGLFLVITTITT